MGEGHLFSHSCWAGHKFGRDDVTSRRATGPIIYSDLLRQAKLDGMASHIEIIFPLQFRCWSLANQFYLFPIYIFTSYIIYVFNFILYILI